MRREALPEVQPGMVAVTVEHRGATPEEVERSVCVRIEEAIEGIIGVERIRSTASEGSCRVSAELFDGVDEDVVTAEIRNKVDGIAHFPDQAEKPVIAIRIEVNGSR